MASATRFAVVAGERVVLTDFGIAHDLAHAHTLASHLARLRGTGGGGGESRVRLTAADIEAPVAAQRTVVIAPFDADATTRVLADDVTRAIADSLVTVPGMRVVKAGAELTLEGAVRCASDRVRIRLRLVDARGEAVWADRVEGLLADPFALEDATSELVGATLRARAGRSGGPEGPIRERYEAVRTSMLGGPAKLRDAIAKLHDSFEVRRCVVSDIVRPHADEQRERPRISAGQGEHEVVHRPPLLLGDSWRCVEIRVPSSPRRAQRQVLVTRLGEGSLDLECARRWRGHREHPGNN